MNLFLLSSFLIVITNFGLALFVLVKGWKQVTNIIFSLITISIGIWGIGGCLFASLSDYGYAFSWWQFSYVGVILIPVFFFHFMVSFLKLDRKIMLVFIYLLSLLFLFFLWYDHSRYFLGDFRWVFGRFWWHDWTKNKNPLWLIFYISFYWILLSYAFFLLVKAYRKSTGLRRTQLKYFILGSLIGWFGPHGDYLVDLGINVYPYSNFLIAIYPLIFTYAIIKYRLMDIRVAITKTGLFLTLYTFVLGVPFYAGYVLTGGFNRGWVIPTTLAVFFATCGHFVYRILQKKAEDILLARQRHYQRLLLQAAKGMVREHNLDKLVRLIAYIVKKTVGVKFAAVFLYDKERKLYELKAQRGEKLRIGYTTFDDDSDAVRYFKRQKMPFIYEEMPPGLRDDVENTLGMPFALVVPAAREGELLGFLILGDKLDKSAYSDEDINVFKILSNQAALAIENCIFFDEFKKAQNRIFEAEKLASIGGMAEGVAHQIKNRLNHFAVVGGELKLELDEFIGKYPQIANDDRVKNVCEYVLRLTDSLLENVKRTNDVVQGILNYARTSAKETYFGKISLREIIGLALDLLKVKHRIEKLPLREKIPEGMMIYGVKAQIMEAIYNILDNAYEAIQEKRAVLDSEEFVPDILIEASEDTQWYIIKISDNGIGIKDEDKPKIFAPFFTTKSSYRPLAKGKSATGSGTGIGMYVVKRMIEENHSGKIWFESEYMKGTTFFIKLPKKK